MRPIEFTPEVPWSESNKFAPIKFWLIGLRPGVYILNIGGDRLRVDHVFCGRRHRFSRDVCCGEKERCWRHNATEKRETNILSTYKYLCWSLNSLHFAWLCTGNSFLLFLLLPPANEVCKGYVFTPVCQSFCSQGGMRGGGCVWQGGGGIHGRGGMHVVSQCAGGMHPTGMHSCCSYFETYFVNVICISAYSSIGAIVLRDRVHAVATCAIGERNELMELFHSLIFVVCSFWPNWNKTEMRLLFNHDFSVIVVHC